MPKLQFGITDKQQKELLKIKEASGVNIKKQGQIAIGNYLENKKKEVK